MGQHSWETWQVFHHQLPWISKLNPVLFCCDIIRARQNSTAGSSSFFIQIKRRSLKSSAGAAAESISLARTTTRNFHSSRPCLRRDDAGALISAVTTCSAIVLLLSLCFFFIMFILRRFLFVFSTSGQVLRFIFSVSTLRLAFAAATWRHRASRRVIYSCQSGAISLTTAHW